MKAILALVCVTFVSFVWFGSIGGRDTERVIVQAIVPEGIASRIEGQGCSDGCYTQQLCYYDECAQPGLSCYVCRGGGYHKWCSGSGPGCTEWVSSGCGERVKGICNGANHCDAGQVVGMCNQYDCF